MFFKWTANLADMRRHYQASNVQMDDMRISYITILVWF